MKNLEKNVLDVEEDTVANVVEQNIAQNSPPSPALPPLVSPVATEIDDGDIPTSLISAIATASDKGGEAGESGAPHVAQGQAAISSTPPLPVSPGSPPLPPFSAASQVTNEEFLSAVFHHLPEGAHAAVCSKSGDPTIGGWYAQRADQVAAKLSAANNNYFNCSSFMPDVDGKIHARKENFAAYHALILDDIGTKVPSDRLGNFEFSYLLETSPGNYQGGIILAEPITNGDDANRLLVAAIAAGLCDKGASGAQGRWMRLPVGINGKAKYANDAGEPFHCRLVEWNPERVYTQQEIIDGLKLELAPSADTTLQSAWDSDATGVYDNDDADDVFTPKSAENPVVTELKLRGLYKMPLGSGKHDVTCPWCSEHTDALDTGAAYFEPSNDYPIGGFRCQHSHGDTYKTKQFLEFLGIKKATAKHKPHIRVVMGELNQIVNTAEKELAKSGRHYQSGGLIVNIATDPETGDPSLVPINSQALTKELSLLVDWAKYNAKLDAYLPCDPPARHIGILNDSQTYAHLPHLNGVTRQPYFRETDGQLVKEAGYDKVSKRFGVFDARKFATPEINMATAHVALHLIDGLVAEFGFVEPHDKSAAISAMFTAVTRPSYPYAPAFHAKGVTIGSGKSYLCELISAFAKPGETKKVSYPATSEEATKAILSLLLTSPAVVEFDDMTHDWVPHGVINRMLTAESITDRILGVSKTATVGTRTLFLASGNNVGPVRDLLRRVVTININHRSDTSATKKYQGSPLEVVRKDRGRYVAAVLTIILAWKAVGSPRADVENIVTYGGAWADYCRHPLIWLGLADPATALLEQVKHDPDAEMLLSLMKSWYATFGSTPTTVRKVLSIAHEFGADEALRDAICEFPVEERGSINASKFGWILKKNVNRVVGGFSFAQGKADGRIAWSVIKM